MKTLVIVYLRFFLNLLQVCVYLCELDHEHEGLLRVRPGQLLPQLADRLNTGHQVHCRRTMLNGHRASLKGLQLRGHGSFKHIQYNHPNLSTSVSTSAVLPGPPARPSPPGPVWCWRPGWASKAAPLWSPHGSTSAPIVPWKMIKKPSSLVLWIVFCWVKMLCGQETFSAGRPCPCGFSAGSGKQGTDCWPETAPSDPPSATEFLWPPWPALKEEQETEVNHGLVESITHT